MNFIESMFAPIVVNHCVSKIKFQEKLIPGSYTDKNKVNIYTHYRILITSLIGKSWINEDTDIFI